MMEDLDEYNIKFVGLKVGKHEFEYKIGKKFFTKNNDDTSLIGDGDVKVKLLMEKSSIMLVLTFSLEGTIKVDCDICLDPLDIDIENEFRQIVKFSDDEFESFDDEITILPSSVYELDVSRYIYEFIHLCIPAKKAHSKGECNADIKDIMDEYLLKEEVDDSEIEGEIDPRWAALKELKNKN